ncbi:chemotaxis protein CheA [Candidatus Bathyarchaeota archaeon]|nr:chemotaxis protein CheA [Candidatus Bathyarchaeota archaeon]
MEQYLELFLEEAKEHLENLTNTLIILEKEEDNTEALNTLFRAAHTLKSSSAMMGHQEISNLSHAMEDVFDAMRDGRHVNRAVMDILLACVDALSINIKVIEDGSGEAMDLIPLVKSLHSIDLTHIDGSMEPCPAPEPASVEANTKATETVENDQYEIITSQSVRVNFTQLDSLMNMVGELVINKISLLQLTRELDDSTLKNISKNIDRLTDDLQDLAMKIRMLPVSQIFNRFPRLVRDLSVKEGKEVNLTVEGEGIEVDRFVLDEIGQPLIHIIRNSIDHGIETPEARAAAGKPAAGMIKLVAQRTSDHVRIEVSDDGVGIDTEKLKVKAIEKRFISTDEAGKLSHQQLINLTFLPGLSTANEVTETSGRGVGMDVVKTKIGALGGTVLLESEPGQGTRIILLLPLTLSIIRALLVTCGGETLALPTNVIHTVIQVKKEDIQSLGASEAFVYRDEVIPFQRMANILGLDGYDEKSSYEVVVIKQKGSENKLGVVVDSVIGLQEILVKPLDDTLASVDRFSGATILGDGSVIMVVDQDYF